MAELKDHQEPTFPSKRKLDDPDTDDISNKSPKLTTKETEQQSDPNSEVPTTTNHSSEPDGALKEENDNVSVNVNEVENDDEFDEDEDEEEEDDDDDDSNGEAEVDRKGKGVLRDDKGKGKLIEEEDDEDDDDGSVSSDDSDFSDDPLAEVDLNNILPSRTRRRTTHPGVHIASDNVNAVEDDDDDSDDSDA